MRETAYAKVNLALHVRAREADGYHRIETVFAFCEDGDVLEVCAPHEPDALELEVTGSFAKALDGAFRDNLVLRAATALRQHLALAPGARLKLDKRLPVAAGLGGGSADAAATMRLLMRWWGVELPPADLHEVARGLGADVPACLVSRTARGRGRGDEVAPVDGASLTGTPILLVNPRVPVLTGPVFAGWDGVDRGPLGTGLLGRNDLEASARTIAPAIGDVRDALTGSSFAGMSGSGATCFGLYPSLAERNAAAARIRTAHPDWWLLKSRLK